MSIIRGIEAVPDDFPRSAVSIGFFDGVHLGHQSLLAVLGSEASRIGGPAVVLTFERHPTALLSPEREPLYINTLDQRLAMLEQSCADIVLVTRFDRAMAELTPEEFVDEVLVKRLMVEAVVIGANFRFGHKRAGDVAVLRALGEDRGFRVVSVEPVVVHGGPVSSTRVRHAIQRGDMQSAAGLLGRPFTMLGRVVTGLGLGRQLGYPTANVEVASRQIVPPDGVYAVHAVIDGSQLPGACSIGTRPTLNGTDRSIEVTIAGFDGDLYGREIGVSFHSLMREQRKFDSVESLVEQIGRDLEEMRRRLGAGA